MSLFLKILGNKRGSVSSPQELLCPFKEIVATQRIKSQSDGEKVYPQVFVHLPYTCYWIVSFTGGDLLLPVDNDFRSFRLDNNGFWYYKPGQSPATATDGRGNKICDPRKTVYEPHEFFRFMYADRWSTPSGKFFVVLPAVETFRQTFIGRYYHRPQNLTKRYL